MKHQTTAEPIAQIRETVRLCIFAETDRDEVLTALDSLEAEVERLTKERLRVEEVLRDPLCDGWTVAYVREALAGTTKSADLEREGE